MQIEVLKRYSDTVVGLFVMYSEKVFYVSKYRLDYTLVTHSYLKDHVLKRRKGYVCV